MTFTGGFGTDLDIDNKVPPIGTIIAVAISIAGCPAPGPRWEVCDGTAFPAASPMAGSNKPNLNAGQNRFLRGSGTSGTTGGAASHSHDIGVAAGAIGGGLLKTDVQSNLPPYYEVVWYIKVF